MSRSSTRDEIFNGSLGSAGNSLLRVAGGWGNIGGPGLFMVRAMTSGTLTAILTGMAGATLSAFLYSMPAIPFIVCSCAGFIMGTVGFYRDSMSKAMIYLGRYPGLMRLHLDANFPNVGFGEWSSGRLRREFLGVAGGARVGGTGAWTGVRGKNMLIVAWLSAAGAIEAIIDAEEQKIVEEEGLKIADGGNDGGNDGGDGEEDQGKEN